MSEPRDIENSKIIIALLDKNAAEMKDLNNNMVKLGDEVKGIGVYFAGMQPQVHILDHAKIQEMITDKKDISKAGRHALFSIVTSIITAAVLAIGAWAIASAQDEFKRDVIKLLEQRK
jgi:ABC-type multidrug transport system fused ATPase/permease subunit